MDVFSVLRVVVSLGAVFGALFFAHRWATKGRPGAASRSKQIAVVARQGIGTKAGVVVVDAGGRRYLLGVTEHAVTVLDTLGEIPAAEASAIPSPVVMPTQPVTITRFEQELRTVTITTGDLPVLVHGREPNRAITQAVPLPFESAPRASAQPVPAAIPSSRRALREAEQRRDQAAGGPLAGSVLSPATWRQTVHALKRER